MGTHYLAIEATNIYFNIADTNKISCIRGGSFILRSLPDECFDKLNAIYGKDNVEAISLGASKGTFKITGDIPDTTALTNSIRTNNLFQYITFEVATTEIDSENNNFKHYEDILDNTINRNQLKSKSLIIEENSDNKMCQETKIRVSTAGKNSDFYNIREKYGVDQKKAFIRSELSNYIDKDKVDKLFSNNLSFTNSLSEIKTPRGSDFVGSVKNKVAYIYFDGDGMGKIINELAEDESKITEFDSNFKQFRAEFLYNLINDNKNDPSWLHRDKATGNQLFKLEILLWGGDEFRIVVPAHKALDTINHFLKIEEQANFSSKPTHSGGLFICNHKTPVAIGDFISTDIAENVKNNKSSVSPKKSSWDYIISESDTVSGKSTNDYFSEYYNNVDNFNRSLYPLGLLDDQFYQSMNSAKNGFVTEDGDSASDPIGRRQLYQYVMNNHKFRSASKEIHASITSSLNVDLSSINYSEDGKSLANTLHLLELWDYVSGGNSHD